MAQVNDLIVNSDARIIGTLYANNFSGSDGTNAGTAGLVPAPAVADNTKFLKGDGTWTTINGAVSTQLTNQDLNDVTTFGWYHAGGNNTITNKPSNVDAFGLRVFNTANSYITQELTEGNTTPGKRWTRQYTGSSWTSWSVMEWADTKNTAGSTDSSSKLFLIGATSQAANPQTYSQDTAYVGTDGKLYSNSIEVVNLSDTQALTNKTYNGYTLAAASAKAVDTSISAGSSSANLPTSAAVATFVEGKGYVTTDTKNTAGSTDTSSKIYLIGATTQDANPQTYSDDEVYATNGVMTAKEYSINSGVNLIYDSTNQCIKFTFN